jgi:hypothetical protein
MPTLQRYAEEFKLDVKSHCSKTELVEVVKQHFAAHPKFRELQVLREFLVKLHQ